MVTLKRTVSKEYDVEGVMWANKIEPNFRKDTRRMSEFLFRRQSLILTKTKHSRKKERILLGLLILLLLGALIVVAVVLGIKINITIPSYDGSTNAATSSTLDVAVIGGGVAGSYVAWNLRKSDLSIQLFEHYNRIGGRLYTRTLPGGTNVELGGGYFSTSFHTLMNKTIHDLGLSIKDAAECVETKKANKMHFVRGKHIRSDQLFLEDIPYNINVSNMKSPLGVLISDKVKNGLELKPYLPVLEWLMNDGTPAYKQSWRHFLRRSTKSEEYNAIVDLAFPFRSIFNHDITLPLPIKAIVGMQIQDRIQYSTITEGMQSLPKQLLNEFEKQSPKHKVNLNHRLTKIERDKDEYVLHFIKTQTKYHQTRDTKERLIVKAKKVVLAVPRRALDLLDWEPLTFNLKLQHNVQATHDNKAFKLFLKYKRKWWKQGKLRAITTLLTDLPLVHSTEYIKEKILLAAYCDDTCVSYWEPLTKGDSCSYCIPGDYNVTDKMMKEVNRQLAEVYGIAESDIPEPIAAIAHSWSADPIGCALSLYRPNYNWTEVMHFMAKPISTENVHIVGSAFSTELNTIWAEGALQSAKYMLDTYFNFAFD